MKLRLKMTNYHFDLLKVKEEVCVVGFFEIVKGNFF